MYIIGVAAKHQGLMPLHGAHRQDFSFPYLSTLPSILPTSTVHTPFRLLKSISISHTHSENNILPGVKQTYLLANPLPAILALHRPLDNIIVRSPPVYPCYAIQREA